MNNLDKQYQALLQDILDNGVTKQDRTGTGTISVFGRQIRHNMKDGFPLLTTKKMAWKTLVTELIWFLRGDTNIKFLVDNGCHIWDGDAYKNYRMNVQEYEKLPNSNDVKSMKMILDSQGNSHPFSVPFNKEEFINKIKTDDEFAKKWGELGPIYGRMWRAFDEDASGGIDQIANLINDLKTNPDSRRLLVTAWHPGYNQWSVLPPCHYGFQVYTRELDLDERAKLHSHPEMFYNINGRFSVDDNIENSNYPSKDRIWLHEQFDKGGIPKRAISLMWNQRSCDVPLGIPMNIASYALLLTMIADEVNMVPDELIGNLGDCHIYLNQMDGVKEQIGRDLTDEERYNIWFDNNYETGMERYFDPNKLPNFDDPYYEPTPKRTREPYPLPKVSVRDGIHCSSVNDIILENYQSHPKIYFPLSN